LEKTCVPRGAKKNRTVNVRTGVMRRNTVRSAVTAAARVIERAHVLGRGPFGFDVSAVLLIGRRRDRQEFEELRLPQVPDRLRRMMS
jgi:hypothetical protein